MKKIQSVIFANRLPKESKGRQKKKKKSEFDLRKDLSTRKQVKKMMKTRC